MYKTKEIILKPLTIEYVNENYLNWFYDNEVTYYTSHSQHPKTIKDLENYINGKSDKSIIFAIEAIKLSEEYIHVGNIALQEIDYINRSAEIAFLIGNKEYWQKGIATKAGMFVLSHGFDKLNLNKIWLGTASENHGMRKVAEKLGMKLEGRLRQGLYIDGGYEDILRYSILKKEWNEIMNNMEKIIET